MSKRRRHRSRLGDKSKSDGISVSDHPASAEPKRPDKNLAGSDADIQQSTKPATWQKILLAVVVALEIAWIIFLVVLAVIR